MNEVYIYRFFGSKESLYEAAFLRLDTELVSAFQQSIEAIGGFAGERTDKLLGFFALAWKFVLGDEERCRCYVRYYYSAYFKKRSREAHKKLFEGIVAAMAPIFKEEADVEAILHSVFAALFNFAILVYDGELEDSDTNRIHIFNVLYCMMVTYFKDYAKALL